MSKKRTAEEIKQELARLQKELEECEPELTLSAPTVSIEAAASQVLVPASPRKKSRTTHLPVPAKTYKSEKNETISSTLDAFYNAPEPVEAKSNYLLKIKGVENDLQRIKEKRTLSQNKSTSFFEKGSKIKQLQEQAKKGISRAATEDDIEIEGLQNYEARNQDGTTNESLALGPVKHKAPPADPEFNTIEPYSRIRLKTREMPHAAFQDVMRDRYFLSPSQLYSIARVGRDGNVVVELDYDFVIIAVIAWKDQARYIRGDGGQHPVQEKKPLDNKKPKENDPSKDVIFRDITQQERDKRYMKFSLVDLSTPTSSSTGSGMLNMLLFESSDKTKPGAYEKYWKETTGAVVAILNPKILKQRVSSQNNNPDKNIYALSPQSADSIVVLGRARDLAFCTAVTKSGKRCSSWCDARNGTLCEYHIVSKVKNTGALRAETNSSTLSVSSNVTFDQAKFRKTLQGKTHPGGSIASINTQKKSYDPFAKTGLLPDTRKPAYIDGTKTYVIQSNPNTALRRDVLKQTYSSQYNPASVSQTGTAKDLLKASFDDRVSAGGFLSGIRDGPAVADVELSIKQRQKEKEHQEKLIANLLKMDKSSSGAQYLAARDKTAEQLEAEHAEAMSRTFDARLVRELGFDPSIRGGTNVRRQKTDIKTVPLDLRKKDTKISLKKPKKVYRPTVTVIPDDGDDDLVIEGMPS